MSQHSGSVRDVKLRPEDAQIWDDDGRHGASLNRRGFEALAGGIGSQHAIVDHR